VGKWTRLPGLQHARGAGRSPGHCSPVLADGRIYVASDRGTITVVKAGDAFEVLAHNDLGDPIIASPAMAENALYIRSAKRLWAFGLKGN